MRTKTENETAMSMMDATKELTEALHRLGIMTDEEARESDALRRATGAKPLELSDLRKSDASSLTSEIPPGRIRALREREGVSQAVFARYLGVATATLSQWERGVRRPEGPALRLMGLAERHGLEHIR